MSWGSRYTDSLRERAHNRFEEKVVDIVLNTYGLSDPWRSHLLRERQRHFGVPALTMDEFHATFPTFPVELIVSSTVSIIPRHPLSKLFEKPASLPIFRDFEFVREDFPATSSVGMVLKWPYFRGALLLHNCEPCRLIGARMQFVSSGASGQLTLQPLQDFLNLLEWEPPVVGSNYQDWMEDGNNE
jgi:hypothetical protein